MDLVAGVNKVVVIMDHVTRKGDPKLIPECTLPLTGLRCVDIVITDLCVLEMRYDQHRFELTELAPDVTVEEVLEKTTADLLVSESIAAS
jgi:3-oxoacid CoA-transferase subunit B